MNILYSNCFQIYSRLPLLFIITPLLLKNVGIAFCQNTDVLSGEVTVIRH